MRRSRRSSLLVAALLVGAAACDRTPRKPIARGDGGPPVVLVERKHESIPIGPTSPELEPNDSWKEAQPIDSGARIAGTLAEKTPADADCYRLRAPAAIGDLGAPDADAGVAASTLAWIAVAPTDGSVSLDLLDEKGRTIITRSAPPGQRVTLSFLRLDASALIRVRRQATPKPPKTQDKPLAAQPATSYTLEYTTRSVSADEEPQPEIEPNDTLGMANALPGRGTISGHLDGNDDRDLVALPALPEGATYRIELAAIAELALEVKLRTAQNTLATARGGKGGELRLRNAPGRALQPLVLQLRAIDGASDTPYTLRVSSEPALESGVEQEPNDDRAHANAAVPGESIAGYLWPGDSDWYCSAEGVALGARIEGLPEVDWKLELLDATGKSIQKADEGKRGAGEELASDPRARCVRVSARARDTAFDAPYRLSFLP